MCINAFTDTSPCHMYIDKNTQHNRQKPTIMQHGNNSFSVI